MKRIIIELPDDIHKKMKMSCLENEKTLKAYVTELVIKDLGEKKE